MEISSQGENEERKADTRKSNFEEDENEDEWVESGANIDDGNDQHGDEDEEVGDKSDEDDMNVSGEASPKNDVKEDEKSGNELAATNRKVFAQY